MWKFFVDGGIFMWIILLASICGLAVVLEKSWYFLKKERGFTKNYRDELYEKIRNGTKKEILDLCKDREDSISRLVVKTLEKFEVDFDTMFHSHKTYLRKVIEEIMLEQEAELERGMWLLGCVVNTAPQLGLLGTVTGMITSFSALTTNNTGSPKVVAAGISEALHTTAFGLIVAIPALVCFNLFNKKIDNVILEMEKTLLVFMARKGEE